MLKKRAKFFENILFISDLAIIVSVWFLAYFIRFYSGYFPVNKGVPHISLYIFLIAPILFIWGFIFKAFALYKPKRLSSYFGEIFDITKACSFAVLVLISLTFFYRQTEYSRLVFAIFWVLTIIFLVLERVTFRELLRYLRRKGYNLRYTLIVGTGEIAEEVLARIQQHPELGIKVIGLLSSDKDYRCGESKDGIPVIGSYLEINEVINKRDVDQVVLALPSEEHNKTIELLKNLDNEMVDIKVIPDIYEFITLRGSIEDFDGIPILNIQDSPLYGWNIILKRAADLIIVAAALIILSPLMILIAILIKATSPGPIFYKQDRMGIGGDTFQMLKFRSMNVDAEVQTGAVWAKENDPRRTILGTFLRKTSLDELPQFFNVLKGDMSIVGPRPERSVFVEEFRKDIPKYMLRHKMKAGITGWAQVNGWRGNTDIKKRIEYDLYYIENWSFWFDLKIMWLTVWKGLINKNAY